MGLTGTAKVAQRQRQLGLVDQGARLSVESEPGKGSTFHVVLALPANPEGPPPLAPPAALSGRRILVVDDNATNRRIVANTVERWGMICTATADGNDALLILRTAPPFDAAILDGHMPEIDGFALAIAIHEQMGLASLPLLLLTSGANRGDARRCRDCGIAAYFPKPVAARDLAGALSRLFGADPKTRI